MIRTGRGCEASLSCVWLVSSVLLLATGCEAPARVAGAEICTNGIDDDGNGAIDCADASCQARTVCQAEICGNNIDDDGDGRFDCADSDCAMEAACGGGRCGNSTLDPGEVCDGIYLGGRSCVTMGFVTGALACRNCLIDTSGCSHTQPESCNNGVDDDQDGKIDCADSDCSNSISCLCGNHVIDNNELCDGSMLPGGLTCESEGFPGGTLKCMADCQRLDTSSCTMPMCGDHIISSGETCDDGNTVAGDGCSPTCEIELDQFCAAPHPLVVGVNTGDTIAGTRAFEGSCTGQSDKEVVYSFTPALSGTLTLVMTSATDQGLYVRSTCADAGTEIGCANFAPAGASEALSLHVSAGVPLAIIVDSTTFSGPSEAGPYTLFVALNP